MVMMGLGFYGYDGLGYMVMIVLGLSVRMVIGDMVGR